MMDALYIKQQTTYINGDKTPFSYARIKPDGKITVVSVSKNRISVPSTFTLQKGFEIISKEEFEKEMNKILNGVR